jgi:hypothetical protein
MEHELCPLKLSPYTHTPLPHLDRVLLWAVLQEPAVHQRYVTGPACAPTALAEGLWGPHEGDAAGCGVTVEGGVGQEGLNGLWKCPGLKLHLLISINCLTLCTDTHMHGGQSHAATLASHQNMGNASTTSSNLETSSRLEEHYDIML